MLRAMEEHVTLLPFRRISNMTMVSYYSYVKTTAYVWDADERTGPMRVLRKCGWHRYNKK
jgi:hypothetical protein